jgi:hypothetical protein
LSILLEKHDVPPCGSAEMPGVVVGISRPRKAVIRHFVPFFARHLARFATNAYSRIREEADFDVFLHVIVPTLIRAVCAFTNHKI